MTVAANAADVVHHPALVAAKAARSAQERAADVITKFAGSMPFVYIHAVIFALWCSTGLFGKDKYPFGLLTMVVSLEAIFLSTFVMVSQNRQADFAAKKADHDFTEQEMELKANTDLTRQVHELTKQIHELVVAQGGTAKG